MRLNGSPQVQTDTSTVNGKKMLTQGIHEKKGGCWEKKFTIEGFALSRPDHQLKPWYGVPSKCSAERTLNYNKTIPVVVAVVVLSCPVELLDNRQYSKDYSCKILQQNQAD